MTRQALRKSDLLEDAASLYARPQIREKWDPVVINPRVGGFVNNCDRNVHDRVITCELLAEMTIP